MRPTRRQFITWTGLLFGGAALVELIRRQGEPPPEAWVRDRLWGDDLLAYAVWDGTPRAVLDWDGKVKYDAMIRGDWFWPEWPPRPQWQLAGLGYSIAASNAPATVGYAPCPGFLGEYCGWPPELFGQINAPTIEAMEVLIGTEWRRFAVSAPGFAVRLDGATGPPAGYRWLDAAGMVIWESSSPAPTSPGAHRLRRGPRGRKGATPPPHP